MKVATKRLFEEQIAAVVVPGRGEKNDAMWHVPHGTYAGFLFLVLIYRYPFIKIKKSQVQYPF